MLFRESHKSSRNFSFSLLWRSNKKGLKIKIWASQGAGTGWVNIKVRVKLRFLPSAGSPEIERTKSSPRPLVGPCRDAQFVGLYRVSSPVPPTVLAVNSDDYKTVLEHLQMSHITDFFFENL